ncbi:MAG: DUF559 domain-containing protein [Kiloniellales bacterium]|nr:DUF559 domain-containing protein [Kiloniellales bacterium]
MMVVLGTGGMGQPLRREHAGTAAKARRLRTTMTDAERRLWSRLRRQQLEGYRFRRQVPLGPFVADFACLAEKLVVELDGGQHAIDAAKDRRRDAWLANRNYRVLRFWNHEVMRNIDGVLAEILRCLESGR